MIDHRGDRRFRALGLAVLMTGLLALAACSEVDSASNDAQSPAGEAPGVRTEAAEGDPGSPQRVAVQMADLPPGFQRCDYSGPIETYIQAHKGGRPGTYEGLMATWEKLKAMGAVDGHYVVYGDGDVACDFLIGRPTSEDPMGPGAHDDNARGHPTTVFSFVARYRDEAAARSTYQSGIFGQSNLGPPDYTVVNGEATGLGPNSVVASNTASAPETNAIWQAKTFTVLFGAENLRGSEPNTVLDNVHERIGET